MDTSTPISLEHYLRSSYHPDREFVAGEFVERNAGKYEHSFTQATLTHWLEAQGRDWFVRQLTEQWFPRSARGPKRSTLSHCIWRPDRLSVLSSGWAIELDAEANRSTAGMRRITTDTSPLHAWAIPVGRGSVDRTANVRRPSQPNEASSARHSKGSNPILIGAHWAQESSGRKSCAKVLSEKVLPIVLDSDCEEVVTAKDPNWYAQIRLILPRGGEADYSVLNSFHRDN